MKRLLSIAAESYSQGRLLEAIEQLSEVVRIDPIIRSSWYTLATIYEELEDKEKALQCKIVATHLMGAKKAAADWVELGRDSRYAFLPFHVYSTCLLTSLSSAATSAFSTKRSTASPKLSKRTRTTSTQCGTVPSS